MRERGAEHAMRSGDLTAGRYARRKRRRDIHVLPSPPPHLPLHPPPHIHTVRSTHPCPRSRPAHSYSLACRQRGHMGKNAFRTLYSAPVVALLVERAHGCGAGHELVRHRLMASPVVKPKVSRAQHVMSTRLPDKVVDNREVSTQIGQQQDPRATLLPDPHRRAAVRPAVGGLRRR